MKKSNTEYCKRYRRKKEIEKLLLSVPFAMRNFLMLRPKWTEKEYETKKKIILDFNSFAYSFECLDLQTADAIFGTFTKADIFFSAFLGLIERGLQTQALPDYAKIFCSRLLSAEDVKAVFNRLLKISGRVGNFILIKQELRNILAMLEN